MGVQRNLPHIGKKFQFPIRLEAADQHVIIPGVGVFQQYIVTGNGFVIASFMDETSLATYMNYLREYGWNAFKYFPENVLDALRAGLSPTLSNDGK